MWSGAISFGLVTIPVKVVSATEDHDVHFHRVHLKDMGRVRTRKVCELDDQVVSQDEIGKGYEIAKDQTVFLLAAALIAPWTATDTGRHRSPRL
ncbi:non-homologous end joining protein Ku [Streptomyces sp. W4I9-2]|nr:non-homologous end joining protein Ku [Streptomyces sp. W4I9-2]